MLFSPGFLNRVLTFDFYHSVVHQNPQIMLHLSGVILALIMVLICLFMCMVCRSKHLNKLSVLLALWYNHHSSQNSYFRTGIPLKDSMDEKMYKEFCTERRKQRLAKDFFVSRNPAYKDL